MNAAHAFAASCPRQLTPHTRLISKLRASPPRDLRDHPEWVSARIDLRRVREVRTGIGAAIRELGFADADLALVHRVLVDVLASMRALEQPATEWPGAKAPPRTLLERLRDRAQK